MLNYKGIPCPVCNVRFNDDDDIVVCPECGAPYHRECYKQKGKCIFPDLHASGTPWEPSDDTADAEPGNTAYEIKDQECPKCGALNSHSALFCNHCGAALNQKAEETVNQGNQTNAYSGGYNNQNRGTYGGMYGVQFNPFDPMGGVDPAETMEDGVSYGEASKLVQINTRYYMQQFKRIKTENKTRFNFGAFICSGPWMLYRKMYKKGIILTSLMVTMYLAQILVNNLYFMPQVESVLNSLGYDLNNMTYTGLYSALASSDFLNAMASRPMVVVASTAMILCYVILFVIMIVCGIKGNRMYYKHITETVKQIRTESTDNMQYEEKIKTNGGTNTIVALVLLIGYIILQNLQYFI